MMKLRIVDTTPSLPATPAKAERETGLYATRNHIPLIARIVLSALFLWFGVNQTSFSSI